MRAALLLTLALLWCDEARADSKSEAKRLFDRAETSFRVGRFDEALADYGKAYELLPRHEFLFNMAQCHRNLGNYERAIFFLEGYLRDGKNVDDRLEVETLIAELTQRLEQQRALEAKRAPATSAATATVTIPVFLTAEPVDPPVYERGWFWGVLLGSAAVVAGAVAIGVVTSDDGVPKGDFVFNYTE
jgi:tetratricopeptide (TPR) repeat protein